LIITEGTSANKKASIEQSSYLSFAHRHFAENVSDLVILGHSLGQGDEHLVKEIKKRRLPTGARRSVPRKIAIGIHTSGGSIGTQLARFRRLLTGKAAAEVYFFDAQSHPLAAPTLQIAAA